MALLRIISYDGAGISSCERKSANTIMLSG